MSDETTLFRTPVDLQEYVFRIVESPDVEDRYTVAFCDGDWLYLDRLGRSAWDEHGDPMVLSERVADGEARDLHWLELPVRIRRRTLEIVNDAFAHYMANPCVPATREEAERHEGLSEHAGVGIYRDGLRYRVRRDGGPADDGGPFETVREAVLYTLPYDHSYCGPEYHPPDPPLAAIGELQALIDAEPADRLRALHAVADRSSAWALRVLEGPGGVDWNGRDWPFPPLDARALRAVLVRLLGRLPVDVRPRALAVAHSLEEGPRRSR